MFNRLRTGGVEPNLPTTLKHLSGKTERKRGKKSIDINSTNKVERKEIEHRTGFQRKKRSI